MFTHWGVGVNILHRTVSTLRAGGSDMSLEPLKITELLHSNVNLCYNRSPNSLSSEGFLFPGASLPLCFPSAALPPKNKCTLLGHRLGRSLLHYTGRGRSSGVWFPSRTNPMSSWLLSLPLACSSLLSHSSPSSFFDPCLDHPAYSGDLGPGILFYSFLFFFPPSFLPQIFLITGQRGFVWFTNMSAFHRPKLVQVGAH